jgi:hypothetical protein
MIAEEHMNFLWFQPKKSIRLEKQLLLEKLANIW